VVFCARLRNVMWEGAYLDPERPHLIGTLLCIFPGKRGSESPESKERNCQSKLKYADWEGDSALQEAHGYTSLCVCVRVLDLLGGITKDGARMPQELRNMRCGVDLKMLTGADERRRGCVQVQALRQTCGRQRSLSTSVSVPFIYQQPDQCLRCPKAVFLNG
jgi:hypothetical protein